MGNICIKPTLDQVISHRVENELWVDNSKSLLLELLLRFTIVIKVFVPDFIISNIYGKYGI